MTRVSSTLHAAWSSTCWPSPKLLNRCS